MTKQILLATYNGEKYLPEQLQSLLAQTDQDWKLLVRDDGSVDNTPKILADFAKNHPDKITIIHDHSDGKNNDNIGPVRNFARLLAESTAPYVMFCDQDDVWYPEKIEQSMKKMHEMEAKYGSKEPLLVHTDYNVTDSDRNSIKEPRKLPSTQFSDLLMKNTVSGFSITMNRTLVKGMQPIPTKVYHDSWAGLVASLNGHIGYVDEQLADYRRHENTVTGANYLEARETFGQKVRRKWDQGIVNTARAMVGENSDYYLSRGNVSRAMLNEHRQNMGEPEYAATVALANLPSQGYFRQRIEMVRHGLLPDSSLGERAQRLILPVKPKDTRSWKKVIEDAAQTAGVLNEPLCCARTDSLLDLLHGNVNELDGPTYLEMLRVKAKEIYKQYEKDSGIDPLGKYELSAAVNDIVATAAKKFVQNAHSVKTGVSGTYWDDVSCGKDIKGVYSELLNEFILPEIKAHFEVQTDRKTEQAGRAI